MIKKYWFKLKIWFFKLTGIRFTSETWSIIFNEITILDPDGWDRSPENFEYEWYQEKITSDEYMRKVVWSTIMADVRIWE